MSFTDHDILVTQVRDLMRPDTIKRCLRVMRGLQNRNLRGESYQRDSHRLIFVTSGEARFVGVAAGQPFDYTMQEGEAIYFGPRSYICPKPRRTYQSLSLLFQSDTSFTKISFTTRVPKRDGVTLTYLAQWERWHKRHHDHLRIDYLFRLLGETGPADMDSLYGRRLCELLVCETLGLLGTPSAKCAQTGNYLWERACNYLAEHWADANVSRTTLARYLHTHPNHVSRIFRQSGKTTFATQLNEIRLTHSLDLLEDSSYNITEIGALCGFTSLQYYVYCFRRRFGITPGQFRNRHRNQSPQP